MIIHNNQEKNYIDTTIYIDRLNHIKQAKAILAFILAIRLITMLKQSILITLFIRLFQNFYRMLSNIYLLSITVILCVSIFFYVTSKNLIISNIFDNMIIIRNTMYDATDSRAFKNFNNNSLFGTFIFLTMCKAFVFSLFVSGLKIIFDEEIIIYNKYNRDFKKKLIGDYLFYLITFLPKFFSGYIFLQYYHLKNIDQEIFHKLKIGLNSFGGSDDVKVTEEKNLKELKKQQIETFYSFFQKDMKIIFLNNTYITELNECFCMEKIELENRDVYLIVEKTSKY